MVTAMEDVRPNGVQEEEEEVAAAPPGQPAAEGLSAVQPSQEPGTSGGEERGKALVPMFKILFFKWTESQAKSSPNFREGPRCSSCFLTF